MIFNLLKKNFIHWVLRKVTKGKPKWGNVGFYVDQILSMMRWYLTHGSHAFIYFICFYVYCIFFFINSRKHTHQCSTPTPIIRYRTKALSFRLFHPVTKAIRKKTSKLSPQQISTFRCAIPRGERSVLHICDCHNWIRTARAVPSTSILFYRYSQLK